MKRRLLIAGGGIDAWLTAACLDAALNAAGLPGAAITVVETAGQAREPAAAGSLPGIRRLLGLLEIDEFEFLRSIGGTYRQAARMDAWHPAGPFYLPCARRRLRPLDDSALRWLRSDRSLPFAATVSAQPALCERMTGPAPVPLDAPAQANYGYHVDTTKLRARLRELALGRGVTLARGGFAQAIPTADGRIDGIETGAGDRLGADLFIDCTGPDALLIGMMPGAEWIDCSRWLPNDKCASLAVGYEAHYPGHVRPFTVMTAMEAGWVAEIPLADRREWIFHYASAGLSADAAERELRRFAGAGIDQGVADGVGEAGHYDNDTGHRASAWTGNCVAVGAAAARLEPLMAPALSLCETAILMLVEHFPYHDAMAPLAYRYNRIMADTFYEMLDFTNLCYLLGTREDSAYWREARGESACRDRNRARLDFWRIRPVADADFEDAVFPGENPLPLATGDRPGDARPPGGAGIFALPEFEALLYGMDFLREECDRWFGSTRPPSQVLEPVAQRIRVATQRLPRHDVLLQRACGMRAFGTPRRGSSGL